MARHVGWRHTAAEPTFYITEAGLKQDTIHKVPNAGLIYTQKLIKYAVVTETTIYCNNSETRSYFFF